MKKAFKIIAVLIIAPLFTYWGYCWYKNNASLKGVIHKDANAVVKIAVHNIKKTLLLNALNNPAYYYKHLTSSKNEKGNKKQKGIDIQPYNLTFFRLPTVKNTLFSVLPIDNNTAFIEQINDFSIAQKSQVNYDKENQLHWLQIKNYGIISWDKNSVVAAIGVDVTYKKILQVSVDVLVLNKTIKNKNHKWIKALAQNNDHIFYASREATISLNFMDGQVNLSGDLFTEIENTYPKTTNINQIQNNTAFLYYDANFAVIENKKNFVNEYKNFGVFKKNNINISEISKEINGFFYLGINGNTIQTDTIISYLYDDNFNKIEQKTAQEKKVPKIEIQLGKANNTLLSYLESQNLITQDNLFKAIPYYQFNVADNNKFLSFKTDKSVSNYSQKKSPYFFQLFIDIPKTVEQLNLGETFHYLKPLQTLKITAQQKEANNVKLEGELQGNLPNINLLSQLLFNNKTD